MTDRVAMTVWDDTDAWILSCAAMRGRVRLGLLNGAAEHTRHTSAGPSEISTSMAKLLSAGLFQFDGDVIRTGPEALAIAGRAQQHPSEGWRPDGWIAHVLSELQAYDQAEVVPLPDGSDSWYDVIVRARSSAFRRLLRLPARPLPRRAG